MKKEYKKWVLISQNAALKAIELGIAPNLYEPYILAQNKCHEMFKLLS